MIRARMTMLLLSLATLLAGPASADDGAIPIYEPTTITESGAYRVTRDITTSTGDVIRVNADDVTIDLAGHRISTEYTYGAGVEVVRESARVLVRNGRIAGGYCVNEAVSTEVFLHVEDIDCEIIWSDGRGVSFAAERGSLHVQRVAFHGVSMSAGVTASAGDENPGRAVVEDCSVEGAAAQGIYLSRFQLVRIARNRLHFSAGSAGIAAAGVLNSLQPSSASIVDNLVVNSDTSGYGVSIEGFGQVAFDSNQIDGAWTAVRIVDSDATVTNNTVRQGSNCILLDGTAIISGNLLSACTTGISSSSPAVVYRDNAISASTPTSGSMVDGGGNTIF